MNSDHGPDGWDATAAIWPQPIYFRKPLPEVVDRARPPKAPAITGVKKLTPLRWLHLQTKVYAVPERQIVGRPILSPLAFFWQGSPSLLQTTGLPHQDQL
jgi:hypothetical protein